MKTELIELPKHCLRVVNHYSRFLRNYAYQLVEMIRGCVLGVVGVNFVASLLIYFRTLKIFVYNLVLFCNLYSLILPDKEELNLLK